MKYIISILILGISTVSFSQEKETRNSIQVYYPNYYFFDNVKFHFGHFPTDVGIGFERFNTKNNRGFHLSFDTHQINSTKWHNSPTKTLGMIIIRSIYLPSIGYDKTMFTNEFIRFNWLIEANGRFGSETFWAGESFSWEPNFIRRNMFDFGLSIGSNVSYNLPFNLITSLSIKQSFYYYRDYKKFHDVGGGNTPFLFFDERTPISSLNINLKIGYQF